MFKSLKRALATATTAALLVSNVGVALAQTFKDVPTDAWYFDYVEQLVDDGVIEAGNTFNPAGRVNRAEMARLVVTAVDGLADYEAPATPTFDDVPKSSPNFDYIEAAVQLGILAGYTDTKGNLTGKFGPGDNLLRDAAAKIIVNAFSIPTTLSPGSIFTDVKEGAWYHDYVVTAYNQSVLNGYKDADGNLTYKFGPADWLNRAQVAKLIVDAQNPVEREGVPSGEGEGVTPPPAAKGALEVSLNDMTAASSTLPISASSVKLASFDFTAADNDVSISNIVVTRGGVGRAGDWNALYLYEGSKRLTTGRSINADTNTTTFAVNITVDAGTTKTLTLVGDVTALAGASNQHYFYLASAADVTTGALSVAGDFPVAGNTFTMGGAATVVNNVTVTTGSAISQPTIGQSDAEVSSFKLAAGATNDIAVHQISLTQNGSFSSSKFKNLRLLRGTDEVATAPAFDGDRVTFVLAAPYVIAKGQTKSFYVKSDIDGGRTTDTVQLYLDEDTDLVVIDQQYGYGALVVNNAVTGFKPGAAAPLVVATALKGGQVTVSDNGPSSKQVAQNVTNVHLLDFTVTAARDLTVKDMDLTIDLSTAGTIGSRPNVSVLGAGTVLATSLTGSVNLSATTATLTAIATGTAGNGITLTIANNEAIDCVAETAATLAALIVGATPNFTLTCDLDDSTQGAGANILNGTRLAAAIANGTGTTIDAVVTAAAVGGGAGQVAAGAYVTAGGTDSNTTNLCYLPTAPSVIGDILADDMISIPVAGASTVYAIITAVGVVACGGNGAARIVTTNNTAGAAIAAAGVVQEINPYTLVKNVKIVDLDSGSTLQGPMTKASDGTISAGAVDHNYTKKMSEDYELIGGEARHLSVQVDIDQTMASGYKLFSGITYLTLAGYIKDMAANENVAIADIVGGALNGKLMSTAANSLTVVRASTPTSQTYVKGDDKVPSLGLALTAGDAGDITIKKINLRVYGVDNTVGGAVASGWAGGVAGVGNWTNITGNIAGNSLVSSVTLYDGNDVVDGPRSLTLVDTGGATGFNAPAAIAVGGDYYKVLFDNLSLKVLKGSTRNLTAKVKLLNSMANTTYIAVDILPGTDITAEDADANTITAANVPATGLNGTVTKNPIQTVLVAGTLSASSEGNPEAKNIVAGATMQLVSKYRFTALREAFNVNKLTVMNDAAGAFGTAVDTNAVGQVALKYTDVNGVTQTKTGSLSGGTATLSDLGFRVPAGADAFVEVYANISDKGMVGESISGKSFRLGIQEAGNTVSTLEAVGVSSSTTLNATGVPATDVVPFSNTTSVNNFVVRKSVPTFAKASGLGTSMINGENRLFGLTVTADALGAISFGRLTFTVTEGITGNAIDNFKFYRGSTLLSGLIATDPVAYIHDATLANGADITGGTDITAGGAPVVVAFRQEETVGAGQSQTYYLDATVAAAAINETINVKLAIEDETVPVAGILATSVCGAANDQLCSTGNGNTGLVFDSVTANEGLFVAAANDFVDTTTVINRSIIWSDKSADAHLYPGFVGLNNIALAGGATAGSYDWTNGYLLKTNVVSSHTLTK